MPLFTLFYVATSLTAETFPTSVALSACQSEKSGKRQTAAAAAVAASAASAAALGGDHSAGISEWGVLELRRLGQTAAGAGRGAEAPPPGAPGSTLSPSVTQPTHLKSFDSKG